MIRYLKLKNDYSMGAKGITICHKRNDCIGCGSCALLARGTWTMNDEDGKADLLGGTWKGKEFVVSEINSDSYEENVQASKACPVGIIRIEGK